MGSTVRKAILTFVIALIAIPAADWGGGGTPFSWQTLVASILTAVGAGLAVYLTPNAPA